MKRFLTAALSRWMGMLLLVAGSLVDLPARAAAPPAPTATINLVAGSAIEFDTQPRAVVARGSVTAADAAGALASHLKPADGDIVPLGRDNEIWIPLALRNPAPQTAVWELQVTLASMDEVTLFERRGDAWIAHDAGDRVASDPGQRASRFPQFPLAFQPGETREVFVRIRNAWPAPVPLRLIAQAEAEAAEQRASLGIGFVLGALALLVAACLIQAALYRDSAYFLYGAYALLLGFAAVSLSGLAAQHLWGGYPDWNDSTKSVFPLAAAGVSVWLVRALCRLPTRDRTLARVSAALGGLVVGTAIVMAALRVAVPLLTAAAMLVAALTVLAIALWTWRRGDPMGGWVVAAHVPLIGSTLLIVLRMFGVAIVPFDPVVFVSIAIGAVLPLLLMALYLRSRESLTIQSRTRELPSIDPLTGLLSAQEFGDRLRAAVTRYRKSRHDAAVLYVRLANYPRIREVHGSAVAEQSVIRAAMKLQRLMPDADAIGRVGESTMGLIIETVTARAALMERAARLVAHGLMALPGLKPEVTLNLQTVGCVLGENPIAAAELQPALESALAAMSPRTRRPIRFLDPPPTHPMPLAAEDNDEIPLDDAIPS